MTNYVYFVSYSHSKGFANGQLTRTAPFTEISEVMMAGKVFSEITPHRDIVILFYELLRTEPAQ